MRTVPHSFVIDSEVSRALDNNMPVVALETAVLSHGLPYPQNIQLVNNLERIVRSQNVVPATIGVLNGKVHIGLDSEGINQLGSPNHKARKISRRDFGLAISRKETGGTTVAGTLITAHAVGIRVFSTGGIGGVHRGATLDISADLPELAHTPMIVVCSGAKAILDLPATLEYLETMGVPIVGYQTDDFPAFYSCQSGLPVNVRVSDPEEVVRIAQAQWELGLSQAILLVVPPPTESAMPLDQVEHIIQQALQEAQQHSIHGAAVTPYLLKRISEISKGASLQANLDLLQNNARIAAIVAKKLSAGPNKKWI